MIFLWSTPGAAIVARKVLLDVGQADRSTAAGREPHFSALAANFTFLREGHNRHLRQIGLSDKEVSAQPEACRDERGLPAASLFEG